MYMVSVLVSVSVPVVHHDSSPFPPLQDNYHRRRDRPPLPTTSVSLVRHAGKSDLRPRPTLHIQLRKSPHPKTWSHPKHKYRISPTDRWTNGTKESMGGTISPPIHFRETRRLGAMASPCHLRTQSMAKRYHKAKPP